MSHALALLQRAVLDGAVRGRKRGIEAERRFWFDHGLAGDRDNIRSDEAWRRKFIDSDAASVDLAEFDRQSEFWREDMIEAFGSVANMKGAATKKVGALTRDVSTSKRHRMTKADAKEFTKNQMEEAKQSGRRLTQKSLVEKAINAGFYGGREHLREQLKGQLGSAFEGRGRPRKSPR